jgi:hypothetical protein
MDLRRGSFAALAATALLAVGGCGEKPEPDPEGPAGGAPIELGAQLEQLSAAGEDRPEPIAGAWRGRLRQAGIPAFPIAVRIASLERPRANVVRYGGRIDCGGYWRWLRGSGAVAEFEEVIDRGAGGDCKGRGVVSLELTAEGALRYSFAGGGVRSEGTLRRAGSG